MISHRWAAEGAEKSAEDIVGNKLPVASVPLWQKEMTVSRATESIENGLSATPQAVDKDRRAPFWSTIQADVNRLREEDKSVRTLIRGLLSQGFQALLVYRIFRWFYERRIPTQPLRFLVERFIEIITGISLPAQATIGKGLRIHHFGGVIIHSAAVIGECCTVYHGVTLGDCGGWGGAPSVGNRVLIGAGAKVIGEIVVGDDCIIGANAVVLASIPPRHLAVGVPAVAKKRAH